mgnify:CR=1 FL=1
MVLQDQISDIEFDEYLAIDALSKSKLARFAEAPILAHYAREKTAALTFGSLIHTAILEPNALELRYQVTDLDRRGSKAWNAEEDEARGRELVKRDEWDMAQNIRESVWLSKTAAELLTGISVEQTAVWEDEHTGLLCKARADVLNAKLGAIIDLKSCVSASYAKFSRDIAEYKYHWQDAFYRPGFAQCGFIAENFIFIAVEKNAPHLVGIYEIDRDDIRHAEEQVKSQMLRYAECKDNNVWPGYDDYIVTAFLPKWAL